MLTRSLLLPGVSGAAARRPCTRGFTLVEMMVTITILVIALSIAVPSMSNWINRQQLKTASHTLQSVLRSAQSRAQSQNRVVALILTNSAVTGDSLDASQISGNLTHWAAYAIPIDGSSEDARLLEAGALHSDNKITATLEDGDAICFNSLGRLSHQAPAKPVSFNCASTATITLEHSSLPDKSATLTVTSGGKTTLTP